MADHECIIGLLHQTDTSDLCTVSILLHYIEECREINAMAKKYMPYLVRPDWTMKDYADRRKSTNLTHFSFCPTCGKKIDWKKVREQDV